MGDNSGRQPDPELRKRLDALKSGLDKAHGEVRGVAASHKTSNAGTAKGVAAGLRVMSEFVAGIVVGAGIGFLLDRWLGTSPLLLLVFLAVGFVAGFRNIYRLGMGPRPPGP